MPKENSSLLAFNRGLVSKLALARLDIKRLALSAEEQTNWMPRVLGSMMLRPGMKYLGSSKGDKMAMHLPFIYSNDDTAIIELTDQVMRVRIDDALVSRVAVSTQVLDDHFNTSIQTFPIITGPAPTAAYYCRYLDGNKLIIGRTGTNYFSIYDVDENGFTLAANQLPAQSAAGRAAAQTFDGSYLATCEDTGGTTTIRVFSVSSSGYTQIFSGTTAVAMNAGGDIVWNSAGTIFYLTLGSSVYIYQRVGNAVTLISSPAVAGTARGVSISLDGKYLAVAHATTPRISIFTISGTTLTQLPNPGTLPTGDATSCHFSPIDNLLAVNHDTSPFITVYRYNTTTNVFTKLANPSTLPTANKGGIKFNPVTGALLAAQSSTVANLYTVTGNTITFVSTVTVVNTGATAALIILSFHKSGRYLTSTGNTNTVTNQSGPWIDVDESTATSTIGSGLTLLGTGIAKAKVNQYIWVDAVDTGKIHAINIHITKGYVALRISSEYDGENYLSDTTLEPGYHSLAITPTGNFFITLSNLDNTPAVVEYVNIDSSGVMEIPAPWLEADLQSIRFDQSGDVIFVACTGYLQRRIERRSDNSWSVVEYLPEDGPFMVQNTSGVKITPSGINGTITLSATAGIFRAGNVGGLFKLSSSGQIVTNTLNAADTYTDPIKVTGISTGRAFERTISGTWAGTITLQRSVAEVGNWTDTNVANKANTTNTSYNDKLDNQVIYYRAGFKPGAFTSGSAVVTLDYSAGSIDGIVRITRFIDEYNVEADVIKPLGGTDATSNWAEGLWSTRRGFPSAVAFSDGRLWWAGKEKLIGSVSDAFDSFDISIEGDAGPIIRSIGSGPVDTISWLLDTNNLLVGGQGAERVARASSLDEPLTPTEFSLKRFSTLGSYNVAAAIVDTSGVFVQRNGYRIYEISMDSTGFGYGSNELTSIIPEVGLPSIVRIAVQRQPDTRIHFVRSDGKVVVLVFDKVENVTCFIIIETDGFVEDVVILPGTEEDFVYYHIRRTINGQTKRYLEKWAFESECVGGEVNKLMDSFIEYSGASTSTITGLAHLEGKSVVVWGNSKDLGTYTVSGGQIALSQAVTRAFVGLAYTARYKSAKMAVAAALGTPLNQRKRIDHLAFILKDTHAQGLRYGPDFENLDDLPLMERYETVDPDSTWENYDMDSIEFPGEHDTDVRICLEAASPRHVTILSMVATIYTNDKG